jgi:hypothetical protein
MLSRAIGNQLINKKSAVTPAITELKTFEASSILLKLTFGVDIPGRCLTDFIEADT